MHETLFVEVLKPGQGLFEQIDRFFDAKFAAALKNGVQHFSVQVIHYQVVEPVDRADLARPHDVQMNEPFGEAGFALKACEQHWILGFGRRQDLDRDDVSSSIGRAVDARHSAAADAVENLEIAQEIAFGVAAAQEGGLIFREQIPLDHPISECGRVAWDYPNGGLPLLESVAGADGHRTAGF